MARAQTQSGGAGKKVATASKAIASKAAARKAIASKAAARKAAAASAAAVKENAAGDGSTDGASETPDRPLLDMSDAAVKKLIKTAKQRGFVTHDELNEVLPSQEVTSEQIEDIMAMLTEMGINVVESEEENEDTTETTERVQSGLPMKVERATEPVDRTDDPVRMYLREMGSVELLSREGEIAIAKRIEAGREAMIGGMCESPLTFQAIIIWRDELIVRRPHASARYYRSGRHLTAVAPDASSRQPAVPNGRKPRPGAKWCPAQHGNCRNNLPAQTAIPAEG